MLEYASQVVNIVELKGSEEEKSIRRKYKILAVKKCTKNSAISSIKIMGNIILGMIDLALFVVPIYMFYNDIVKNNIDRDIIKNVCDKIEKGGNENDKQILNWAKEYLISLY